MYNSILIPLGLFGAGAVAAKPMFDAANALKAPGGKITLLHVIEELPKYRTTEFQAPAAEQVKGDAEQAMATIVADTGIDAEQMVVFGHPARTILDEATKIGADCIVMKSHRPSLTDYFIGSTATHVVRHAKCTVLVDRSY